MDVTTLAQLLAEGCVTTTNTGLIVVVPQSWIAHDEDRVSHTTLVRLAECCREHHWNLDVQPYADAGTVDSTIRSLSASFIRPVKVGTRISINYKVTHVGERSYVLRFEVRDMSTRKIGAEFEFVSVFFDPVSGGSALPPAAVRERLKRKSNGKEE